MNDIISRQSQKKNIIPTKFEHTNFIHWGTIEPHLVETISQSQTSFIKIKTSFAIDAKSFMINDICL